MKVTLQAEARVEGKRSAAQAIRAARKIPAVIYGPETQPISITVDSAAFGKVLAQAGESTLIDLEVGGTTHPVLVKDLQTNPMSGAFTHIDFYAVSMKKELETDVALEFVGEAEAVKMGGTLMKIKDALTVRCLPKDLVRSITVSLDKLKTYDDVITVGDIELPAGLTALADAEDAIAKVSAPLTEEQLKALEEENSADVSKVEVVGKKDDAEEGEATE